MSLYYFYPLSWTVTRSNLQSCETHPHTITEPPPNGMVSWTLLAAFGCLHICVLPSVMCRRKREREMFYLTTHSTHFIYGYMASDIWLRTILIVRKETRCRHIGYSYRLTARVLLYAPSHRQDSTYHGLCYTSRGALAGTRNSSMGPPHEGSIRRPIAPWANVLPLSYVPLLQKKAVFIGPMDLSLRCKIPFMAYLTPCQTSRNNAMFFSWRCSTRLSWTVPVLNIIGWFVFSYK